MSRIVVCWFLLSVAWLAPAQAHLMPARHGTLNLVGDGAYLVLSVPAAAFGDGDTNQDGSLSLAELRTGWNVLTARIQQTVQLLDAGGARPFEGLILTPTAESDAPGAPMTQLLVMGRFALAGAATDASLRFRLLAFDPDPTLARAQLRVTRGTETSLLWLDRTASMRALFPSRAQVLSESFDQGFSHILRGYDHLLFMLVVLLAVPRWRTAVLLLSSFTLGHAVTLLAGGLGWIEVPASVVEPTILATIAGMASLDLSLHWRRRHFALHWRVALVYACALVHGLGFSQAARDMGLQGDRLWPTLLGFNLGIEAGQCLVAFPFLAVLTLARHRRLSAARAGALLSRA